MRHAFKETLERTDGYQTLVDQAACSLRLEECARCIAPFFERQGEGVLVDKNLLDDIEKGIVLHLDPSRLLAKGGKPSGPPATWVVDWHFFLCIEAGPKRGRWTPLFSKGGPPRIAIGPEGRSGHEKWTGGAWHYHPAQVWTASHHAVMEAAHAGKDQSLKGHRNSLDVAQVPAVGAA